MRMRGNPQTLKLGPQSHLDSIVSPRHLSYRDVEDFLAERGLMVSNESIRRWVLKFGPIVARNLRE